MNYEYKYVECKIPVPTGGLGSMGVGDNRIVKMLESDPLLKSILDKGSRNLPQNASFLDILRIVPELKPLFKLLVVAKMYCANCLTTELDKKYVYKVSEPATKTNFEIFYLNPLTMDINMECPVCHERVYVQVQYFPQQQTKYIWMDRVISDLDVLNNAPYIPVAAATADYENLWMNKDYAGNWILMDTGNSQDKSTYEAVKNNPKFKYVLYYIV
jgi:hypothetical protein